MFCFQAVDMWSLLSRLLQRAFALDCACCNSKDQDFGKLIIAHNCSPCVIHYCLYNPECCACRCAAAVCEECSVSLWLWGPLGGGPPAPQSHRRGGEPRSALGIRLGAVIRESTGLPACWEGSSVRHSLICTDGETLSFGDPSKEQIINFITCFPLLMSSVILYKASREQDNFILCTWLEQWLFTTYSYKEIKKILSAASHEHYTRYEMVNLFHLLLAD